MKVRAYSGDERSGSIQTLSAESRKVRCINVEPIALFYAIYQGIVNAIFTAFVYFKSCMERFNGSHDGSRVPLESYCKSLGGLKNSSIQQELVEADAAYVSEYILIAATIPACLVTVVIGAWSDRHGRKAPLVINLIGTFVNAAACTYSATYVESPTVFLVIGGMIAGLTGGPMVIYQLMFSMVRDSFADPKTFSVRLGITMALGSFGNVVGGVIGGYSVEKWGYRYVMLIALICLTLTLLYLILLANETLPPTTSTVCHKFDNKFDTALPEASCTATLCDSIGITPTIWTLIRLRPDNKRFQLALGLLAFLLMALCDIGIWNLLLLYVKLPPILWPDSLFSYYTAYTTALSSIGGPLLILLLKRCFNCRDTVVVMLGLLTDALKFALLSISKTTYQLLAVGSLSVTSSLLYTGFRAHLVMLVSPAETGRVFALVAVVEVLGPLLSSLIFNNVYPKTIAFFPGLIFAVGGALLLLDFMLIWYAHLSTRTKDDDEMRAIICNPAVISS